MPWVEFWFMTLEPVITPNFNHVQECRSATITALCHVWVKQVWEQNCRHILMTSPFCVVDSVSEPRCVYDGEPQFDSFLLDANCVFDDVDCLIDPVCRHIHVKSNYNYTETYLSVFKRVREHTHTQMLQGQKVVGASHFAPENYFFLHRDDTFA